jgi:hypothetical protein
MVWTFQTFGKSLARHHSLPVISFILLDAGPQIDQLAGGKGPGRSQYHRLTIVVGAFITAAQPRTVEQLTACSTVYRGDLISGENSGIRALGYARTTVDASLGVDVKCRPLLGRLAGADAFHRADVDTTIIAQAETGNYVGHIFLLY